MKIELSKLEADKTLGENEQNENMLKSNTKFEITKIEQNKLVNTSKVQTEQEVQLIKTKLEKEVEFLNIELEEKNNKAKFKSNIESIKSKILAETTVKSESIKIEADAMFYKKQKEAEGIKVLYEAEAKGLEELKKMFGNDNEALLKYIMIKEGQLTKLAEINSNAIKGLNPKITIWNTSNGENVNGFTDTISNIMKSVPPLFSTIEDQTGIKLFPTLVDNDKKE